MSALLTCHWPALQPGGMQLVDCQVLRLHARGRHGFFIDYGLTLETRNGRKQELLFVEVVPEDPLARYLGVTRRIRGKTNNAARAQAVENGLVCLEGEGLLLRRPGLDERLPGLNFRYRPDVFLPCLCAKLRLASWDPTQTACELVSHRLGKRAVQRLRKTDGSTTDGEAVSLIAKSSKRGSDAGKRARTAARALWQAGFDDTADIRVPRSHAFFEDLNTEIMEDLPGTSLNDLEGDARISGMALAGRALARIHDTSLELDRRFGPSDECNLLASWAELFVELRPELAPLAMATITRVNCDLDACRYFQAALLHRDYHDKQIIIAGDRAGLIDFDTLCQGDPALDVGNFLAHVTLSALQEQRDLSSLRAAFLGAYEAEAGPLAASHLRTYEKSALLRLAFIYGVSTSWRHLSATLLQLVLE
jgi:tRNA A-37 threonylcarbamoyl transferase component Bud32